MTLRLAVYRRKLLPYSETFVLNQLLHLRRFQPLLVGQELIDELPLGQLPVQLLAAPTSQLLPRRFGSRWQGRKPDLVLAHFGPDGLDAYPLAVRLGVPLVVLLHGYDVNTRAEWWQAGHRGRSMRGYPRSMRMLARDPNVHFLAISQSNQRAAVSLGLPSERVRVAYLGVDTQLFRPRDAAITARAPRVLLVGRLTENKGCDYLLRAMAEV
jgi:glycosyltransferase involved in cell wall biosynthesis